MIKKLLDLLTKQEGKCAGLLLGIILTMALTTYAQLRFTLMREYNICKRLVEGYLHQPHSWFLSRHNAGFAKKYASSV